MKAYFEGDKNVLVFKPVRKRQSFRKTNEERLKSLNTKELAQELALIAEWDRKQLAKAKNGPGLVQFMEKWLQQPAEEDDHA